MKRNKLFLLGLFVVFAAVLSLSLVSSTFAKYTSTNSDSDTARVAKWGVAISAANFDSFDAAYAKDDDSATTISTVSVVSANSENVLAPGTTRNLVGLAISGAPEVAVEVTYTATLTLSNWTLTDNTTEYCPVIFTVNGEDFYIGKTDIDDVAELKAAVEAAINGYSAKYDANSDLSGAGAPVVSWRWEFTKTTTGSTQTDVNDSILGDKAAQGNAPTITLALTASVVQID